MLSDLKGRLLSSTSERPRIGLRPEMIKRLLDIIGASAALIVFAPVLLVSMLALRLGGARSMFFTQERVGQHNNAFRVIKLATMRDNSHLNAPLVTPDEDPRVTRMGRYIRAFGFNELPQFVNVLRGEMSIVGPRPEVPSYIAEWPAGTKAKVLSVRPGITGFATLHFWNEASLLNGKADLEAAYIREILPEKLKLDAWYAENWTLWLDLKVMFVTLAKALGGSRLSKAEHGVGGKRSRRTTK